MNGVRIHVHLFCISLASSSSSFDATSHRPPPPRSRPPVPSSPFRPSPSLRVHRKCYSHISAYTPPLVSSLAFLTLRPYIPHRTRTPHQATTCVIVHTSTHRSPEHHTLFIHLHLPLHPHLYLSPPTRHWAHGAYCHLPRLHLSPRLSWHLALPPKSPLSPSPIQRSRPLI